MARITYGDIVKTADTRIETNADGQYAVCLDSFAGFDIQTRVVATVDTYREANMIAVSIRCSLGAIIGQYNRVNEVPTPR